VRNNASRTEPILVTGCSSGIGRATALRLAKAGRVVYATARNTDSLRELAEAGARCLPLDVTSKSSMTDAVEQVRSDTGGVASLINNAGYALYSPIEEVTLDAMREQFETNVFGLVQLTQLVLPGMRERGNGRIINVSSMGGRMTLPGGGVYHASKYAVEAISDALRFEVAGFGIHVSVIEPGPVLTDFAEEATTASVEPGPYAQFRAGVAARNSGSYDPRGSSGTATADDVAKVIEKSLNSSRPRSRYLIGAVARSLVTAHTVLPTPVWDLLLRQRYPPPQ
jgi:NAD(P)-dependent dehydrogenase (short-subunit alcohol dehydrogenase family)